MLDQTPTPTPPAGFFYDDLHVGLRFTPPPAVRIGDGIAALYTAISGDSLALTQDPALCHQVTGSPGLLVNPALVMHVAVGATTVASRNVIGNLFYRNVVLHRQVFQGEILRTLTGVAALADSRPKPGAKPRGKALLSIKTTSVQLDADQADDPVVIDCERCPLLPCKGDDAPGHSDDIGPAAGELAIDDYRGAVPGEWNLSALGATDEWVIGETRDDLQRDVVDMATALVRITHNQAAVHRDRLASPYPDRLVYGGHTVALAQASLDRILGGLATVVGWHACNHTAPVFEGDILSCSHTLVDSAPVANGNLRAVNIQVEAHRDGSEPVNVLDWTPVVLTT